MIRLTLVSAARPSAKQPIGIGWANEGEPLPLGALARSHGVERFSSGPALLGAVKSGRVRAAVRGTLPASAFWSALQRAAGGEPFSRAVLLEAARGRGVLLGPVGIEEGQGAAQRTAFGKHACRFLEGKGLLSEAPLVAVLSLGRLEDGARGERIARSLRESEKVVNALTKAGIDAFSAGVQIEDVFAEADVVVMPDGAAGNLAFRALHLVAGKRSFGAPVLGAPFDLVDTSRSRTSYADPLRLAAFLARAKGPR